MGHLPKMLNLYWVFLRIKCDKVKHYIDNQLSDVIGSNSKSDARPVTRRDIKEQEQ